MSRRSLRAAGLRRPSESRAFLASRSTIYLDDACGFEPTLLDLRHRLLHDAKAYWRSEGIYTNLRNPRNRATFMPSRRRPPAAVGKPSFAYFPVDYLPHDVWRPDEPTDLRDGDLPDATPYERSEDHGPNRRNPRNRAVRLASAKTDSFNIVLPSQQFWS
ncbi:hypothetical protein THAOC_32512, partial [Thalassiosira oceanica]